MSLLEPGNISGSFGAIRAPDDNSPEVVAGEIPWLMGEHGDGKSALVEICELHAHAADACGRQ